MASSLSGRDGAHAVAGQSLLDHLVPLRATYGLIQEQRGIHEAIGQVFEARAITQNNAVDNCQNAATRLRLNDIKAALRTQLELKGQLADVLNHKCGVELENAALTVQVKHLLEAEEIHDADDFPELPVFAEHNHDVFISAGGEESCSSLAAAFWDADGAQQKAMQQVIHELKTLSKDRATLYKEVQCLLNEREQLLEDEEVQKQRCYEAISARDKTYESDVRHLKEELQQCQTELAQQRQLVSTLQARQQNDTAVQDVLRALQSNTEGIAPSMQKTEQWHEAMQQQLQNAQAGFEQQHQLMQGVHDQVSQLDNQVKHYKELCEKEREATARVKEQLQKAQQQACATRDSDAAAAQTLQQEQAKLLQGLRDQMTQLQADRSAAEKLCEKERQDTARIREQLQDAQQQAGRERDAAAAARQALQKEQAEQVQGLRDQLATLQAKYSTSEERAAAAEKESASLKQQLQASQAAAQAAEVAAVRTSAAADHERLFSAQKEWFAQQLQPLLQQPHPLPAAAEPAGGDAGAPAAVRAAPAAAAMPAGASPPHPSSAAFMSEEEGDAADGAAAYADVGRLAQALAGRGVAPASFAPIAAEEAEGEAGAQENAGEEDAGPSRPSNKRQGRPPAGRKAAAGGSSVVAAKKAGGEAPQRKKPPAAKGGKRGSKAPVPDEDAAGEGSPAAEAELPAKKRKRASKARSAAAAAADAAAEQAPAPAHGGESRQGAAAGSQPAREGAAAAGRVLRARKPGLTMADDESDGLGGLGSDVSSGASEAQGRDAGGKRAKARRTSGAKQVETARRLPLSPDTRLQDEIGAGSPLMGPPDSPRAMQLADVMEGAVLPAGGSPAAASEAAPSPGSLGTAAAPVAVWQDPKSAEVQPGDRAPAARARPPLAARPLHESVQNIQAGGRTGRLGVHSVVGSQAGSQLPGGRAGSQGPNSMRDPETFGIVRNPMAAMTSKVMEATKASRHKIAMSWGEKLAVKASERLGRGRPGQSSGRALSQSLSSARVNAPTNELFPNGYKRVNLRP
eukprot:jgi/Ulvmu1/9139/UM005_0237.1